MTEVINCLFCNSSKALQFRKRADIVQCLSCNIVYLRTRPTKETMYQIYQGYAHDTSHMKLPNSLDDVKKSGLRREYFVNEAVDFLQDRNKTWLDIGCGWGALLNYSRELGFTPRGVELTINCLDYATMKYNIPVSNAQFTDSSIEEGSCSVVSMVHVLEHIPNPKETLKKIFSTLEPGGLFCGIVPNIESLCSEMLSDDWVWLDPTHHYVHYSPLTLKQKLEETGFVIERMYTSVGDYDYAAFKEVVKTRFSLSTEEDVLTRVQDLEKIGKGEEIRFFARKKY